MHKITLFLITFLALTGLLLSACSPSESQATLAGTSWKLVSYGLATNQTPAITGVETTLTFSKDGQVSGSFGCNQFSGNYSLKDGKITFGALATTMMACADPQMIQESTTFKVMTGTVNFEVNGKALTITAADNSVMNLTSK